MTDVVPRIGASIRIFLADGIADGLTEDYVFPSPSTAAMVLLGRTANGRVEWKSIEGNTLKGLQSAEVPGEHGA